MPTWQSVWEWGLQVIRSVQAFHGPVQDSLMTVVTAAGTEECYILIVSALIWSRHRSLGLRVAIWLAAAGALNAILKDIFSHPRPFHLDPSLQLVRTSGYGFPSGHAQAAVVFWGYLAIRSRWVWHGYLACAWILLIGFSRVYLGVHFPTDVLAGWGIGFLVLLACLWLEPWLIRLYSRFGRCGRLLLALFLPAIVLACYPIPGVGRPMGMIAGLMIGSIFGARRGSESGRAFAVGRFLIGIGFLALLNAGGQIQLVQQEGLRMVFGTFLLGAILGLWISLGAPHLFHRLGLMRPTSNQS